jgi:hypothetical protein
MLSETRSFNKSKKRPKLGARCCISVLPIAFKASGVIALSSPSKILNYFNGQSVTRARRRGSHFDLRYKVNTTMPQPGFPCNIMLMYVMGRSHPSLLRCFSLGRRQVLRLEICFRLPQPTTFRLKAGDGHITQRLHPRSDRDVHCCHLW